MGSAAAVAREGHRARAQMAEQGRGDEGEKRTDDRETAARSRRYGKATQIEKAQRSRGGEDSGGDGGRGSQEIRSSAEPARTAGLRKKEKVTRVWYGRMFHLKLMQFGGVGAV